MTEKKKPDDGAEVIAELKRLGRQLGETLNTAWKSAERKKAEEELRAGARAFAGEFERAFSRARSARPGDVSDRARSSVVDGLRWLSSELETLADRFTPAESKDAED